MNIPSKVRRALKERACYMCERCGVYTPEFCGSAHHRRNRSQGGGNELSNLLWLCGSGTTFCHGWVTSNPKAAHADGFTLRAGESTARPVLYRGRKAVLHDNGLKVAA